MRRSLNQRGFGPIEAVTTLTVLLILIALGFFIYGHTLQSWTGSGTVTGRTHHEATEGDMLLYNGISYFFVDTSTPESYALNVRDDNGNNHPFNVTKEQFDSAAVGARYVKSK